MDNDYTISGEHQTLKGDIEERTICLIGLAADLRLRKDMNKNLYKKYILFRNMFFSLYLETSPFITKDEDNLLPELKEDFYNSPDYQAIELIKSFQKYYLVLKENGLTEIGKTPEVFSGKVK